MHVVNDYGVIIKSTHNCTYYVHVGDSTCTCFKQPTRRIQTILIELSVSVLIPDGIFNLS